MNKKVAVLGSGGVGVTLAQGFQKHGYPVVIGTKTPAKQTIWSGEITTYEDAAKGADILVLAVKGSVAEDVVKTVSAHAAGKTVIDAVNPIAEEPQ